MRGAWEVEAAVHRSYEQMWRDGPEDYTVEVVGMLLRDSTRNTFDLERRREAFKSRVGE
jgi:hypothetical protein